MIRPCRRHPEFPHRESDDGQLLRLRTHYPLDSQSAMLPAHSFETPLMKKIRVVCGDTFYHEGRGPALVRVHIEAGSAHLQAIDYELPDTDGSPASKRHLLHRHLLFHGAQVFMFTPDKVENYITSAVDWSATGGGAMVALGKSIWLSSFNQQHLERCEHYRAMFAAEFLDVICEGVTSEPGYFSSKK
jgi:hypothetical protein